MLSVGGAVVKTIIFINYFIIPFKLGLFLTRYAHINENVLKGVFNPSKRVSH